MTAIGTLTAIAGRMLHRAPRAVRSPVHAPLFVPVTGVVPDSGLSFVNLCAPSLVRECLRGVDPKDNPHMEMPARIEAESRMLRMLADDAAPLKAQGGGLILRLHLKSLVSAGFISFERAHGLDFRDRLTISVPMADAVGDSDSAAFAVNYLGSRGHGFAVHGFGLGAAVAMPEPVVEFLKPARYLTVKFTRADLSLGDRERTAASQAILRLSRTRLIASTGSDGKLAAIARECGALMFEGAAA